MNHRYILSTSPEIISSLVKEITENNKIYISHTELGKTPLLEILFTPVTGVEAFSDYLIKVLEELNKVMSALSDEEEEDAPQRTNDLEQEFIFHYFTTVNRMKEVMKDARIEMKIDRCV